MRKLYILAVFCFAIYSCTRNLDSGNMALDMNYGKSDRTVQNETMVTNNQEEAKEKVEAKNEEITEEQMLGEQIKVENNFSNTESLTVESSGALLDMAIIPTMTVEKLEKMISAGADVNAKKPNGTTVLMLYSASSSPEIIQKLLQKGADVNAVNLRGGTALIAACQKNTKEVINLLVQNGADPYVKASNGKNVYDFLETNKNLTSEDIKDIYDTITKQLQQ